MTLGGSRRGSSDRGSPRGRCRGDVYDPRGLHDPRRDVLDQDLDGLLLDDDDLLDLLIPDREEHHHDNQDIEEDQKQEKAHPTAEKRLAF